MKKIILVLLTFIAFTLGACGGSPTSNNEVSGIAPPNHVNAIK